MSTDKPHVNCLTTDDNLSPLVFQNHSIGIIAHESLTTPQTGKVRSVTSKGIFIETSNETIVFLSFENYKGPLTINVPELIKVSQQISPEEVCEITSNHICFPLKSIKINLDGNPVWKSWNANLRLEPLHDIYNRAELLLSLLLFREGVVNELLLEVYQRMYLAETYPRDEGSVAEKLEELAHAILSEKPNGLAEAAAFFVGRGKGLTPSGDDLLLGLILAWKYFSLSDQHTFPALPNTILEVIRGKTTLISQNLIRCAVYGEVDERLHKLALFVFTGKESLNTVMRGVLTWGSSSGIDTTAGIALYIWCLQQISRQNIEG